VESTAPPSRPAEHAESPRVTAQATAYAPVAELATAEAPAEPASVDAQPAAPAAAHSEAPSSGPADSRPRRDRSERRKDRDFESPPMQGPRTPVPNRRSELSEDMQQELDAALADLPVDDLLKRGASAVRELEPESRHMARVAGIHRDLVFVEIGQRNQGTLPLEVFPQPPEVGAEVEVVIARFKPEEGLYELTVPGGAVDIGNWSDLREGLVVEARITGHNKGGLECEVNNIRGFLPASQVSLYRVEDLSQFVGQSLNCLVTEANRDSRNLVLSRRAVLESEQEDAKRKLLEELAPGQVREGIVRSLQPFGAFIDLGGVDGLIHISQLSWERLKHASEALELGQKVKVKIAKMDQATGKISLAFRDLSENPWARVAEKFPAGRRVTGTVTRLTEFGAFVRLDAGIEGLVHISELSHKRVWRASDVVQEGQEVEVQIVSVDPGNQRIALSLKALQARAVPEKKVDEAPEEEPVPVRKSNVPLKGGLGRSNGGESFGLRW
jgi:small subunit ribosomal protein S1